MNSAERREARYQRRKAARDAKLHARQAEVGSLPDALTYSALYYCGKAACKGVNWKSSTKGFRLRIFSRTARSCRRLKKRKWKCKKPFVFPLMERGHLRIIDAPHIEDRQVHKAVCKQVLRPLYYPHLIYDNGASMKGKGFAFAIDRLLLFLRRWYAKYGTEGYIINLDFKSYFPTAPHSTIEAIHERYILDPDLRYLADYLLNVFKSEGMSLGVETSQTEAGILPNYFDHALKDQAGVKDMERYMDDTILAAHDLEDVNRILAVAYRAAEHEALVINEAKTHVTPLTGWFTYCQWRFHMTETGRIIVKPSRRSITNMNHKLNAFRRKVDNDEMTIRQVCKDYECWRAYVRKSDSHNILLMTDRHFYRLFGFYPKKGELPP